MHAMQERVLQREPNTAPYLLFDCCTRLDQVWRLSAGCHSRGTDRLRFKLTTQERIRVRRIGDVDLTDAHTIQKKGVLCGCARQVVVEDARPRAYHRLLPIAGRVGQRKPGSEVLAVVKGVLPVVAQTKRYAKVWQCTKLVFHKSAGLLCEERNSWVALIHGVKNWSA